MNYTYANFKDKTKEGITRELSRGLARIAFYFVETFGFSKELFKEYLNEKCPTDWDKIKLYLNFRSKHPEEFEDL